MNNDVRDNLWGDSPIIFTRVAVTTIDYTYWLLLGHEWGDTPIIFTRDAAGTIENHWRITSRVIKNLLFTTCYIYIYIYVYIYILTCSYWRWNTKTFDVNSQRSITAPLLFTMGQSLVMLWRNTRNSYRDVILTDGPQNVSKLIMRFSVANLIVTRWLSG